MIVVGGEALVDLVPAGEGGLLAPRLGGSPYNVAIAAGRLAAPTAFMSRISTDGFGTAMMARLADCGVETELVQRGPQPTPLAVVGIGDGGAARYTFYTQGTADGLFEDPGPLPPRARILSLGSLAMALEPGASGYRAVLRRASEAGVLTVFDPNIRSDMIADPDGYRQRFASWLPEIGLLKLSEEDAQWLAGDAFRRDPYPWLREWQAHGPAAIVLTLGGDGLRAIRGDEVIEVRAPEVAVVDTIGAGDTVHAAVMTRLHGAGVASREELASMAVDTWREVLEYAARAAAVTVSRAGAEPPTAGEVM